MIKFLGQYDLTLDAKGRFLFPAGFKKQMPEDSATQFVITIGLNGCLALHPLKNWDTKYQEISELDEFDSKVVEFQRKYLDGANFVDMDSAGRINIPKNLMAHAGLEKDVVLASRGKLIEIWDAGTRKKYFEYLNTKDFSEMASSAMAKKTDVPKS